MASFLATGLKIVKASDDYRHFVVKLKLRWWNANYVGTHFGGAIYTLSDPFYIIMLIKNLGSGYVVWDKAALIHFLKPGKTDLSAEFLLSEEELQHIRCEVDEKGKMQWKKIVEIIDAQGVLTATAEKTLHISKKVK